MFSFSLRILLSVNMPTGGGFTVSFIISGLT
jgi:hypothetical protein